MKLGNDHGDYLLDISAYAFRTQSQLARIGTFLFSSCSVLISLRSLIQYHQILNNEPKSPDRASRYLLLVAGLELSVFNASINKSLQVWNIIRLFDVFEFTADDIFDRIQIANEAQGPRVTDVDIYIGIREHLGRKTDLKNGVADVLAVSENTRSLLVLNEVAKCFDDCCFQHTGNSDILSILNIEDVRQNGHQSQGLFVRHENLLVLFLIHNTNNVEKRNCGIDLDSEHLLSHLLLPTEECRILC